MIDVIKIASLVVLALGKLYSSIMDAFDRYMYSKNGYNYKTNVRRAY